GKAETIEFQVADQRRMAQSHKEVGVQVEAIARQSRLLRGATATDVGVSFDDRDFQAGACQISRKRESVVSGSNDDTIEFFHSLLPTPASSYCTSPRSTMAWMPLLPSTSWVTRRSQARLQKT